MNRIQLLADYMNWIFNGSIYAFVDFFYLQMYVFRIYNISIYI
jgi:hypothetical protein